MANKRGKTYEAPDMLAMLRRVSRALVRRAQDKDLEALSALSAARADIDAAITEAAQSLHANGYSWEDIGREIGTSRQSAQQRFAPKG